jgi:nitroreductase
VEARKWGITMQDLTQSQGHSPEGAPKRGKPSLVSRLKSIGKRYIPKPLFSVARASWVAFEQFGNTVALGINYSSDLRRYARWGHNGKTDRYTLQREAALLKQYHGLEKALSLQNPRPGFGQDKVRLLIQTLDGWLVQDPLNPIVGAAIGSLQSYRDFQQSHGINLTWLDAWLDAAGKKGGLTSAEHGGARSLRKADVLQSVAGVHPDFFSSRHSIRHFGPGEVPMAAIEQAISMASKTPSVCNRQGPRAYCFADAMDALQWQPGNGGFGHLASRALIITSDLQAFSASGERHQAYVDGGLFAMSVVYALHSMGFGCCMLAWSQPAAKEKALRQALKIPHSEVVIMMIAVGQLPDELMVASAYRRPISEILQIR